MSRNQPKTPRAGVSILRSRAPASTGRRPYMLLSIIGELRAGPVASAGHGNTADRPRGAVARCRLARRTALGTFRFVPSDPPQTTRQVDRPLNPLAPDAPALTLPF